MRLDHIGARTGWLYGLNTIGAALGVILCGFVLIKNLGVSMSLTLFACINGVIGLSCLVISRFLPPSASAPLHREGPSGNSPADNRQFPGQIRSSEYTDICRFRILRHGLRSPLDPSTRAHWPGRQPIVSVWWWPPSSSVLPWAASFSAGWPIKPAAPLPGWPAPRWRGPWLP